MTFQIKSSRRRTPTATDRQERIDWWSQDLLREARIMVVGAGALGNEVVKNLALLGVGYILIVDFDQIEISNLSRTALFRQSDLGKRKATVAAERARELCVEPSAEIEALDADVVWEVGLGVYRRMDLVLGCLDNLEARLAVNRACLLAGKPFIDGGIRGLAGSVYLFAPPCDCCFNCTTTKRERAALGGRYDSCFQIMRANYSEGRMATVQVTSAIIAAMQVEQAVKCLHGRLQINGVRLQYDGGGAKPYFEVTPILRRQRCECKEIVPLPEVLVLEGAAGTMTLRDCLAALERMGMAEPLIKFPSSFVSHLFCGNCNHETALLRPVFRLANDQVQCQNCKIIGDRASLQLMMTGDSWDVMSPDMADYRDTILDLTLHDLGFPHLAIFQVQDRHGRTFDFELSQDEESTLPGSSQVRKRMPAAGKVPSIGER
jgi:adenylyltransferase/sulfurtransferase